MDDTRKEILKIHEHRTHRVNNSLGVYDAYKWLRKNKWLDVGYISEHNYYAIIRTVNKELAKNLLLTSSIVLPERMGEITLRKYLPSIKLEGGKIKTNLPIDWNTTLSLWTEDKDAYQNKTLIRAEEKQLFKVCYDKSKALYNNKSFYNFTLNRAIKVALKEQIKNGKLDAFMLCGKT